MKAAIRRNLAIGQFFLVPLIASVAVAGTAPYVETFDDGVANGFISSGTAGAYAIQAESPGYSYRAALSASTGGQSASSGLEVTNVSAASCIISTDFEITSFTANGSSIVNGGLALFSNSADFSTGSQYRLYYQITNGTVGKLQLMRNGTTLAVSSAMMAPRLNVKYTISAIISYSSGSATIQGLLYDDTNTLSITVIDNAPLPGTYFGYRTAISTAGAATGLNIRYDNFDVLFDTGGQPGDGTIVGNLLVGGSVDVTGNTITIGEFGGTYGAGLIYNSSTFDFSSQLTATGGTWSWQRGSALGMALDAQNRLSLISDDGVTAGIFLNPRGVSEFKAVHVREGLSVGGSLRIAPQGNLLMGNFTADGGLGNPAQ